MGDILFCFFDCVGLGYVIVLDLIELMLVEGCKCVEVVDLSESLFWVIGDVMGLLFFDNIFDVYIISFGIWNVICL